VTSECAAPCGVQCRIARRPGHVLREDQLHAPLRAIVGGLGHREMELASEPLTAAKSFAAALGIGR